MTDGFLKGLRSESSDEEAVISGPVVLPRTLVVKAVNALLREVETHCTENLRGFRLFSASEVSRRITQLVLKGYYTDLMLCCRGDRSHREPGQHHLQLGGNLTLQKSPSTRISVHPKIVLAGYFNFAKASIYLLLVFVTSAVVRRRGRSTGVAATVIGPRLNLEAFMNKEDIGPAFARFCRDGPIPVLTEAELILCREEADPEGSERLLCLRENPLCHLLKNNPPSVAEVLRVLADQVRIWFLFSRYCLTFPAFSLLHRDLGFFAIVASLNRRGLLKAYLISNSEYYDQELWLSDFAGKSFSSNMLWYSSGFEWYRYRGESEFVDSPENQFFSVDHHWVWTAHQKTCIEKMPHSRAVTAVGPVMYYLPNPVEPARDPSMIGIFDMTPRKMAHFQARFGPDFRYYNSADTVRSFMERIVAQVEQLEQRSGVKYRLLLKSKRGFEAKHDPGYLKFIGGLEDSGRIELLSTRTNIFDFAKECSALIVLPFTSPGSVGASVGTPTLYYDPTHSLEERPCENDFVRFAHDDDGLAEFLLETLGDGR